VIDQNPVATVVAALLPSNNPAYVNLFTRKFIMGIVSFSHCFSQTPVLSLLLTPLQTLVGFFGATSSASGSASVTTKKGGVPRKRVMGTDLPPCQIGEKGVHTGSHLRLPSNPSLSPLKIVRQFEPGTSACCAGRMTISGKMSDVCAELDRMAQREAGTSRISRP
jgi:hypothetical protein